MAMIYNSQLDAFELYHRNQADNVASQSSTTTSRGILRALSDGLAGSAGAAISNVATYPLDLIITRLQIQRQLRIDSTKQASNKEYTGFLDAATKIVDRDSNGWRGLYAGLASDTGKTLVDSFIFFLLYDSMRKRRLRSGGSVRKMLPAAEELGVGFVAGSLTKLCTTPISNIVTRKQAAALTGDGNVSVGDITSDILEEKGLVGFWSGYSASLVLTLNPSMTFFLFEMFKKTLLPRSRRDNPPAAATFLLAAISKACASSVTYPFSLAKARLQAGNGRRLASSSKGDEVKPHHHHPDNNNKAKKASRTTIFSTLMAIAHNEGISALYEGLHLEIVKAFFSHGTTMLVKQTIQRLLLKLYYISSIIWSSWTGKANYHRLRLREKAKKSGHEYYDLAIKRTSERLDDIQKLVVEDQTKTASDRTQAVIEFVGDYVDADVEADGANILTGVTTATAKRIIGGSIDES